MRYIQRKDGRTVETVDEFETYREARNACLEYRMSDPSASYYISSRACKDWRESKVPKVSQNNTCTECA